MVGLVSESVSILNSIFAYATDKFCPNCRCDILNFSKFVGTTTISATAGKGSYQERKAYHSLYGEMMWEVPHYTDNFEFEQKGVDHAGD